MPEILTVILGNKYLMNKIIKNKKCHSDQRDPDLHLLR